MSALHKLNKVDDKVELTSEDTVIFKIYSSKHGQDREWDFEATADQLDELIGVLTRIAEKRRKGSA
ncbi:hypothetical protein [Mesorhizobium sp. M1272]|uniref:hypothetical protein n=1 Tax=Mesorhizobium sp. M1272 TaxID=2957074 RepID=UPI0033357CBD